MPNYNYVEKGDVTRPIQNNSKPILLFSFHNINLPISETKTNGVTFLVIAEFAFKRNQAIVSISFG